MSNIVRMMCMGVCGAVAAGSLISGSARAEELPGESLAGYQGRAAATGLHVMYNPYGLLPLGAPIVDVSVPDALATVTTGPTTFARAAVIDPGDILANPDAVLALADPRYPAGTLPRYPYRVTASSGVGAPDASSSPAPGLVASVHADERGSTAAASMARTELPGVATIGSMRSESTTVVAAGSVEVRARVQVSDLNLLGLLTVDSVVTEVTAASDGSAPRLAGTTRLAGAKLMGTSVAIDAEGVHVVPGQVPTPPLRELLGSARDLRQQLERAGLRITVSGPVRQAAGTAGQLSLAGLHVELELSQETVPALAHLLRLVPSVGGVAPGAPSVDDVVQVARARHVTTIDVGGAAVTLSVQAGPAFGADGEASVPPGSEDVPPQASDVGDASPFVPVREKLPTDTLRSGTSLGQASSAPVQPASVGAGIGATVVLVLLAQPLAGHRVRRLVTLVLDSAQTEGCVSEAP